MVGVLVFFGNFSFQGNGSIVFPKIFQEAGWVAMETNRPGITNTIQFQTESKAIFSSHNVSHEKFICLQIPLCEMFSS